MNFGDTIDNNIEKSFTSNNFFDDPIDNNIEKSFKV